MTDAQVDTLNKLLKDINIIVKKCEDGFVISTNIDSLDIEFICKLPESFPYVFPVIYISQETRDKLGHIPHINKDLSLCLFNDETDIPNFDAPIRLIEATIRKAHNVIYEGIHCQNQNDFLEEFNEYWTSNSNIHCFSNVVFDSFPLTLKGYIGQFNNYISDTISNCKKLAKSNFEDILEKNIIDCIYIPLLEPCYDCSKTSHLDLFKIIKEKSAHLHFFINFIQNSKKQLNLVVFSQPYENSRIISGFFYEKPPQLNGFRKGKTPIALAVSQNFGSKKIKKVKITDISQEKLFTRGGTGLTCFDKKIGILGCGSLGSNMAQTLVECGCHKFSLYDNQLLTAENIARHICGYSNIGFKKTSALRSKFEQHNPNISVDENTNNIHDIITSSANTFNNNDYNILTVANTPIEYRFVKLHLDGILMRPLIIMWLEPYAICGHALVLNKPQDVFKEFFTPDFSFKNSIVVDGNMLYKRECGCQSTYMPYSGIDAKMFAIQFCKLFLSNKFEQNKNYHFLWTGNLSDASIYKVKLSEVVTSLESNKAYIERID